MTKTTRMSALLLLAACGQLPDKSGDSGAQELRSPAVELADHYDASPPLMLMRVPDSDTNLEHEVKRIPRRFNIRAPGERDPVHQSRPIPLAVPTAGVSWEGVGQGFVGPAGTYSVASAPPDTNGDVGPNHYVQIVNTSFAIFNKSGTVLYGPTAVNSLWSGFGGGCQTNNDGDPLAVYDPIADRWVISQFSVNTLPYLQCIAVSQTPDPTGAYYRYSFSYSAFNDYPKMGVWPDGYYFTYNMFTGGTTFAGGKICAMDRARMLTGAAATQQCFDTTTAYGGLLPADLDGTRRPVAGEPEFVVGLGSAANTLALWKFKVDWTTPANTTFTGPTTLNTATFSEACAGGTCIPQPGTTQQLDSLADRMMYRLQYRNFADHESLVTNHSVTAGSSTGVRWYEIRDPNGTPSIYQQGTYAPDSNYRWMGSAAMDSAGGIGLAYSVSSSSTKPAIRYTGRNASDALGTMTAGEGSIIEGAGVQFSSTRALSRWGDYSMLGVDPTDDCTFWFTTEYIAATGVFNWHTRVGSFKLDGCGPAATNDFSISANPATLSLQQGASGTSTISTTLIRGTAETVTLSASGLPAGAAASFNPASVTAGGSSTMTLSTAASTPSGTYPITVTGTATSATHTTSVSLTVTAPAGSNPIVNGNFETGNLSGWTSAGSTSIVTTSHTGTWAAQVGSTSPGTDSSLSQSFVMPSGGGTLSLWYQVHCPDTITYDWAFVDLVDNTAATTTSVVPKTCTNTATWVQATVSVAASAGGHNFTLKLGNHDDNYAGDATYTWYDDVVFTPSAPPDFSISANPTSISVPQGGSGTSTISTTAIGGTGTVNLTASVSPAGPTASLNPTSVTAGSSSTLTVSVGSTVGTGS
jgi:hypothetical protein